MKAFPCGPTVWPQSTTCRDTTRSVDAQGGQQDWAPGIRRQIIAAELLAEVQAMSNPLVGMSPLEREQPRRPESI